MISVIYGQRGSGKSVLGLHELRRAVREPDLAQGIVVDTLVEERYAELPCLDPESLSLWLRNPRGAGRICRVVCPMESELDRVAGLLEHEPRPVRAVLLVEELSYWSQPNRTAPGLSRLIRYGRHWRVDLIGIGRRPAEISREFSSQIDRIQIFRSIEPNDIRYYSGILPPDAVERIPQLAPHHYLEYNSAGSWSEREPVALAI